MAGELDPAKVVGDLHSLGLELPSPAYLLGLVVFGIIGYAAFRRGRKSGRPQSVWAGAATMVYPYCRGTDLAALAGRLCGHRVDLLQVGLIVIRPA